MGAEPLDSKQAARRGWGIVLLDCLRLAKPRISLMVVFTTGVGYVLGRQQTLDWLHLGQVLLATLLLSGGIMAINQWMERDTDGLMRRTRQRPLAAGRISAFKAWLLAACCVVVGLLLLMFWANVLTALVGLVVVVTYLLCYTPLKRHSMLNTLVGAIPGALPPVLGWAAAQGRIGTGAVALFLIMFVWQLPHVLAIAYLYREDYARAGLSMITVMDPSGGAVRRQLIVYCATLIPVSLYPSMIGLSGELYFFGALLLSLFFFAAALRMVLRIGDAAARLVLRVSLFYLPLLFALMLYDASGRNF